MAPDAPEIDELIGRNARERLTEVKRGLRSILEMLAGKPGRASSASRRPRRTAAPRTASAAGEAAA